MPEYEAVLVDRIPHPDVGPNNAPTLTEIDRLNILDRVTWSKELNNDGFASVSTRPERLEDALRDRLIKPDERPMELWIFRDGIHVYSGPLIGIQIQGQNRTITFHSRGLAYYTRYMFLTADFARTAVDNFTVVRELIATWQDQSYGHFGIFDEVGSPLSGNTIDVDYKRVELVNIAQTIGDLSLPSVDGFDFEFNPSDRRLYLYSPQRGTDKTNTIVIDNRNLIQHSMFMDLTAGDFATTVIGAATAFDLVDGPFWSQKTNATRRSQFGYAGLGANWSGITSQATLDDFVQAAVDTHSNFPLSFGGSGGEKEGGTTKIQVTEGFGPLDVDPGDTISIDADLGFGEFALERDVQAVITSQDAGGDETMSVNLI